MTEAVDKSGSFTVRTVEIQREEGQQSLGFYIRRGDGWTRRDGVFISRVVLGSVVDTNGLLGVGDEILQVNNVDVTRLSLEDVVVIMKYVQRLLLTVKVLTSVALCQTWSMRNNPSQLVDIREQTSGKGHRLMGGVVRRNLTPSFVDHQTSHDLSTSMPNGTRRKGIQTLSTDNTRLVHPYNSIDIVTSHSTTERLGEETGRANTHTSTAPFNSAHDRVNDDDGKEREATTEPSHPHEMVTFGSHDCQEASPSPSQVEVTAKHTRVDPSESTSTSSPVGGGDIDTHATLDLAEREFVELELQSQTATGDKEYEVSGMLVLDIHSLCGIQGGDSATVSCAVAVDSAPVLQIKGHKGNEDTVFINDTFKVDLVKNGKVDFSMSSGLKMAHQSISLLQLLGEQQIGGGGGGGGGGEREEGGVEGRGEVGEEEREGGGGEGGGGGGGEGGGGGGGRGVKRGHRGIREEPRNVRLKLDPVGSLQFTVQYLSLNDTIPRLKYTEVHAPSFAGYVESNPTKSGLPLVLEQNIHIIEEFGLHVPGLYQYTASESAKMLAYNASISQNKHVKEMPSIIKVITVHAFTSVLKDFFRNLPEPFFTSEVSPTLTEAAGMSNAAQIIASLTECLPEVIITSIEALFQHLKKVCDCSETNGATPEKLGRTFGHLLLLARVDVGAEATRQCSPQSIDFDILSKVVSLLIAHY